MTRTIVTGTGNCGTRSAAKQFGLTHETAFTRYGFRGWQRSPKGDASLCAVPWLSEFESFYRILVIRHPFIWASTQKQREVPLPAYFGGYEWADQQMRFYVEWNREALKYVDDVILTDDLQEHEGQFAKRVPPSDDIVKYGDEAVLLWKEVTNAN